MFVPTRKLKLEGQEFLYNQESKTIILEITQLFRKAGYVLAWNYSYGIPGVGINKSIMDFVIKSKLKILIHLLENDSQTKHWVNFTKLNDFINSNTSEYLVSGKKIHVIPWSFFISKPNFSGVNSL